MKRFRILTSYSNSSHFNTCLKKETTSYISEMAVFCLQTWCSYLLLHDSAPLPHTQHTNRLVVTTTWILCRFTLGLPKYDETQKLRTYQSPREKFHFFFFFFGYWTSSYSSMLTVLFGSADGELKELWQQFLLPYMRDVATLEPHVTQ